MTDRMLGLCAVLASLFSALAGVWILAHVGLNLGNQVLTTAIGLYFLGKAFFLGPALWALRSRRR